MFRILKNVEHRVGLQTISMRVSGQRLLVFESVEINRRKAIEHFRSQYPPLAGAILKDCVGGPGGPGTDWHLRANCMKAPTVEFTDEKVVATGEVKLPIARFRDYD